MNSKDENFRLWDAPEGYRSLGLPAFKASEAARLQGEELFARFRMGLLCAKHVQGKNIAEREALVEVAGASGLELSRFSSDMDSREALRKIEADYNEAANKYGVFGTPTFVFDNGEVAFVKLNAIPPTDGESLELFDLVVRTASKFPYFLEMKKPIKPH